MLRTRGTHNIDWIENFCTVPSGPDKGRHVRLTPAQRDTVRQIYDHPEQSHDEPVTGPLAAYLALLHVAGPEALQHDFRPAVAADLFTVWGAVGPGLREVLKCDAGAILCRELGTKYEAA